VKDQWLLEEAQDRLEDVVEQAVTFGPQTITVRGEPKAVVVSTEEYNRLTRPTTSLADFLMNSPLRGSGIDLERSTDTGRDIEL